MFCSLIELYIAESKSLRDKMLIALLDFYETILWVISTCDTTKEIPLEQKLDQVLFPFLPLDKKQNSSNKNNINKEDVGTTEENGLKEELIKTVTFILS